MKDKMSTTYYHNHATSEKAEEEDSWIIHVKTSSHVVNEEKSCLMAFLDDVVWDEAETAVRLTPTWKKGEVVAPGINLTPPSPSSEQPAALPGEEPGLLNKTILHADWKSKSEWAKTMAKRRRQEERALMRYQVATHLAEMVWQEDAKQKAKEAAAARAKEGQYWAARLAKIDKGCDWW
ncbi:hypothetical protein KVT40_001331 [Elsinoe batatas]|uniref:Uncharacterized protein n=1 Tax=Elsinoe batatas TaxID=2601811 RepID=A0A8K0L688_9PEZI|nr:hypothetical protein KVT40_001331 [Elsinoe batatas]